MIKKISLQLLANFSGLIHMFIGTPLILSEYGIELVGLNSALLIIISIMIIFDLGIPAIAGKEVAQSEKRERKSVVGKYINIALYQWIYIFIASFILTSTYLIMVIDKTTQIELPFISISIFWGMAIASTASISIFGNILVSLNRSVYVNYLRLISTAVIILALLGITFYSLPIQFYYLAYALATFFTAIVLYRVLKVYSKLNIRQLFWGISKTRRYSEFITSI